MKDYKVMFVGSSGSGKTTAISTVSEITPVITDVMNTDCENLKKETTTVGLDYGEVSLPDMQRRKMRLYGTPGQARFSFMWKTVVQGTTGIVLLADNSLQNPLEEIRHYLQIFKDRLRGQECAGILGISKTDINPYPGKREYQQILKELEIDIPIVIIDTRDYSSVMLMLTTLSLHLHKEDLYGDAEEKVNVLT
jgi:small GTP-binding protein